MQMLQHEPRTSQGQRLYRHCGGKRILQAVQRGQKEGFPRNLNVVSTEWEATTAQHSSPGSRVINPALASASPCSLRGKPVAGQTIQVTASLFVIKRHGKTAKAVHTDSSFLPDPKFQGAFLPAPSLLLQFS